MIRFDFGPLLQRQMRIARVESISNSLMLVLEVCNVKRTFRKLWASNLQPRFLLLLPLKVCYIRGYPARLAIKRVA